MTISLSSSSYSTESQKYPLHKSGYFSMIFIIESTGTGKILGLNLVMDIDLFELG